MSLALPSRSHALALSLSTPVLLASAVLAWGGLTEEAVSGPRALAAVVLFTGAVVVGILAGLQWSNYLQARRIAAYAFTRWPGTAISVHGVVQDGVVHWWGPSKPISSGDRLGLTDASFEKGMLRFTWNSWGDGRVEDCSGEIRVAPEHRDEASAAARFLRDYLDS